MTPNARWLLIAIGVLILIALAVTYQLGYQFGEWHMLSCYNTVDNGGC